MPSPHAHTDPISQLQARVAALEALFEATPSMLKIVIGDSEIIIKKSSIELSGRDIIISADDRCTIKASGDIVLRGSKIQQN